jgi:hypothetical protein
LSGADDGRDLLGPAERESAKTERSIEVAGWLGPRRLLRERRRRSEGRPLCRASREAGTLGPDDLAASSDRVTDVAELGRADDTSAGDAVGANSTPAPEAGAVLRIEARVMRKYVLLREGDVLADADVRPDHLAGALIAHAA